MKKQKRTHRLIPTDVCRPTRNDEGALQKISITCVCVNTQPDFGCVCPANPKAIGHKGEAFFFDFTSIAFIYLGLTEDFLEMAAKAIDEWDKEIARTIAGDNPIAIGGSTEVCDKIHAVMTFDR
jgi:hypothetical protein